MISYETWQGLWGTPASVKCGNCKATGLEHKWTAAGDFVPVEPERACKACNGIGRPLERTPPKE